MNEINCNTATLKTLFLFEKLDDHQLEQLCENGHVETIEPGSVYGEDDDATCFYVLIEGEVVLSKLSGGENIEMNRTSQRGVYTGAWQAYLGNQAPTKYQGSMRVTQPSTFFVLDADKFGSLVRSWFPMAVHLLEGLFFGNRNSKQILDQRERLLALGSLSAGLTHELNNPAAAAVRATDSLRDRISHMRHKLGVLASGAYAAETMVALVRLQEEAAELVSKAPDLTPMETADREDQLGEWFDARSISGGWDLAATFVQAGFDVAWLDRVAASVDDSLVEGAIRWLNYTVETELLMNEIADSTARVSTLVNAAKQYSQMDRAPYQRADLRVLIKSTMMMMGRKIGDGITVVKDFDPAMPLVPCFAAELNQVWTNLIDNALSAMDGHGTLTLRTAIDGDLALIEIGDTGPGVDPDIRSRIFEPFFTTKAVGEGTGLGLDISWRIVVKKHGGDLRVESEPGNTRFQVRIPLEAAAATIEAEGL